MNSKNLFSDKSFVVTQDLWDDCVSKGEGVGGRCGVVTPSL